MINIDLDGKIYHFPNTWSEISLGNFQKIIELKNETDGINTLVKIISTLSGIDEEVLNDLPYTEFIRLSDACEFVFTECKEEPKFEFTLNGVKYKMMDDITKIKTAEYIDLDTLLRDKENTIGNLHVIMAILYRPKNKNGEIEKYDSKTLLERAELFKDNMTCDYCLSAMLFSSALAQVCVDYIKVYSKKQ